MIYPDDILLLSASVGSLQKMLDICYRKGETIDIIFNVRKSALFMVGKAFNKKLEKSYIDQEAVAWLHGMIM